MCDFSFEEKAASPTVQDEAVSRQHVQQALALLESCAGTGGPVVEALYKQCFFQIVQPSHDGYCYLAWFDQIFWPDLAEKMGAYPKVGAVLEWARRAGIHFDDELYVARMGVVLHAVSEDHPGAVPYFRQTHAIRASLDALPVGGGVLGKVLVTMDIPDPDNFLMAYQVISGNLEEAPVDVVMHPRPVDLGVVPPTVSVPGVFKLFPETKPPDVVSALLTGGDSDPAGLWIDMPEQVRLEYSEFRDFSDRTVKRDSTLYMKLSVLRLQRFLSEMGVLESAYRVFVDHEAMSKDLPRPLSHAIHKEDYFYGYSHAAEYRRELAALRANGGGGDSLRPAMRYLRLTHMRKYMREMAGDEPVKVNLYGQLLGELRGSKVSKVYVGGPFTQLSTMLEKRFEVQVGVVYAMAAFLKEGSSLFRNQFNIGLDPAAAEHVFKSADDRNVDDLFLLPTEFAKGSVYELKSEDLPAMPQPVRELVEAWNGKGRGGPVFDWVLVLVASGEMPAKVHTMGWSFDNGLFRLHDKPEGSISVYVGQDEVDNVQARHLYEGIAAAMHPRTSPTHGGLTLVSSTPNPIHPIL
ncbi:hypothetical protein BDU57DRAFT_591620 [Ampelomyces quisqualis]|uniref:Uncharacterized protein n=1 Tax=Ampelomyces quisqualis TaxID=50730 RepID=A0A6A5R0P0_AMPQU|nr:hypothetical protein BDU57DRAFT_591620 [Ampelomyces quisqualis]